MQWRDGRPKDTPLPAAIGRFALKGVGINKENLEIGFALELCSLGMGGVADTC